MWQAADRCAGATAGGRRPNAASFALLLLFLALSSCATTTGRSPYTLDELTASGIAGHRDLRFFPDRETDLSAALGWQEPQDLPQPRDGRFDILALSSGGPDGSYGVGGLKGMAETGTLADYEVVTGVSTGALIAPFIFVGAGNLPLLERIYTDGSLGRLLGAPNVFSALGGPSLYTGSAIPAFMNRHVEAGLLRQVAAEHARGRRLLLATANIDAGELVVWNMGRIATLGGETGLELFRAVMRAAIAVPGALPPVAIAASTEGKALSELHGDAGVVAYFYADTRLVPAAFLPGRRGARGLSKPRIDVILHNQIEAKARPVEARAMKLAGASVSSMARTAMRLLLDDTIRRAAAAGLEMRYAFVPGDWRTVTSLEFDREYMRRTLELGRRDALSGAFWHSGPRR